MNKLNLTQAVRALKDGKTIIYPTETFYALGCDVLYPDAVAKIFLVKQRNNNMPLPVIIGCLEQLALVARTEDSLGSDGKQSQSAKTRAALIEIFWPAPLSILFPAREDLPLLLTGGSSQVAVRLTSHEGAAELCCKLGSPLVSSSANISGQAPAGKLEELTEELTNSVDGGFYDAPPTPSGNLPSTVLEALDPFEMGVRIRRPGVVTQAMLEAKGFRVFR